VYAKRPFGGAEQGLSYLAAYTHRIAIPSAVSRASPENGSPSPTGLPRCDREKSMELAADEFLRHYLLHVLPERFVRIRSFGFLAIGCARATSPSRANSGRNAARCELTMYPNDGRYGFACFRHPGGMSNVELERQKLEAEVAKISAETDLLRRQGWSRAADFLKVAGAIVATIAGLYAVITTYRITQLETRLALTEREQAEKERAAAVVARTNAQVELDRANIAKGSAERELATLVSQVEAARHDIATLTNMGSVDDLGSLLAVSSNLEAASQKAASSLPFVFIVPATSAQANVASKLTLRVTRSGASAGMSRPLRNIRNAPQVTELHYFKPTDRAEADRLATVLHEAGANETKVVYANRPEITRHRYYELRLPIRLVLP
jgi:hypothetical protein